MAPCDWAERASQPTGFSCTANGQLSAVAAARDEERPDASVIVLSTATWRRHFGSDPAVLDRSIVLDDHAYSIVGVLPSPDEEFRLLDPNPPRAAGAQGRTTDHERHRTA
jgi:hypothetical protein